VISKTRYYDEVWDSVYFVFPLPNLQHQDIVMRLSAALYELYGRTGAAIVLPGANVSDRDVDWKQNYRCPDVVAAFPGGRARDCGAFWCGGPDFLVEIVSPDDKSRDKFDFYAQVGVRELLLIDRDPWALELYRLQENKLALVGTSTLDNSTPISNRVLDGLSFRLVTGDVRPQIEMTHGPSNTSWVV